MADRTLKPRTDLPDAEKLREPESLKDSVDPTDQTRVVLFPFLSAGTRFNIGGWNLVPWHDSQDLPLSAEERQRCEQWLKASESQNSVVCMRMVDAELPLDDLCTIVEYASISQKPWREHKCGGRCFCPVRVATPPGQIDMPQLWPPRSPDTGYIDSGDPDLYTALAAAFAQVGSEKNPECSRLRRALTFFNEAHRASQEGLTFDDLGPYEPGHRTVLWLMAGLGMAFEALFSRQGRRQLTRTGDVQLLGALGHCTSETIAAFVASSSYCDDLRDTLAVTSQLGAEAGELANAIKARLESGLDAVSATLRSGLAETLRPFLTGTHGEDDLRRVGQWFAAFYALRSRMAHGNEVAERDLYEKGLSGGRWFGTTARAVFRAVVVALLSSYGFYKGLTASALLAVRYIDPAVQAVLTKRQRIARAVDMIGQGKFTGNEEASELSELLASIAALDGDDSFDALQLDGLKLALDVLVKSNTAPQFLKWKAAELYPYIRLLGTLQRGAQIRSNRRIA